VKKRWTVGALVLALAALTASLVGTSALASSKLTQIRVGLYPSADYAPFFVALKRGIFKKHGLDVKVTYVFTGSGLMASLTSGQADFATNSVTAGITAINNGLPIKMLASADIVPLKGNTEVLVKQDSSIRNWRDLEGKTVATVNLQGLFHLGLAAAVEKAGGDPKSIRAVPMSPVDEGPALEAGRLDAVVLQDPFLTQAKQRFNFRSLGNPYTAVSYRVPAGAIFASNKTIEEKPGLVRTFTKAWKDAADYARTHPKLARQVVPKYTGITNEVAVKITLPIYDTTLSAAMLGPMMRQMKRYGWLDNIPSYQQLVWTGR
jgi:NitT/TauT family transport system substrate-binding protein